MRYYILLSVTILLFSCSDKLDRLEESNRNYEPLEKFDCNHQSSDIFLLKEQNFETINDQCQLFCDSILGNEWSDAIKGNMTDSIARCLFLLKNDETKTTFFELDSSELFVNSPGQEALLSSWNQVLLNGGDSYTYFEYEDHSVSINFQMCFDEPIAYLGRMYEQQELKANTFHGQYRNAYSVDLKLVLDFQVKPPTAIAGNLQNEYYRLIIPDRCTLLRTEIGDKMRKNFD
ncbi:MAG: hypothetical protein MI810_05990 [Flavobacteriales bacterium]|nr:hypothetical protein [Flavobacteriales bacterium]